MTSNEDRDNTEEINNSIGQTNDSESEQQQEDKSLKAALITTEERLDNIEKDIYVIKQSMVAWNKLIWSVIFVILCLSWGIKIWAFLKEVYIFLYHIPLFVFENSGWYLSYTAEAIIGGAFAVTIMFIVISRLIFYIDLLIDKIWAWLNKRQKAKLNKQEKVERLS
ncbi:MAG: hypothetical protein NG737_03095 [Omnitrophica bacterium]|nr:hypothetical protein [Candidatus Omnitrophota bacterium]